MKKLLLKISMSGIGILFGVLFLYFILSIIISPSHQFVHNYYPPHYPMELSKSNGSFIKEVVPDRIEIIDSIGYANIREHINIYMSKSLYYKNYGVFNLFEHTIHNDRSVSLNIGSDSKSWLYIQYGTRRMQVMGSSNSFWNLYQVGSNVIVRIFDEEKKEIVLMHFLNLGR